MKTDEDRMIDRQLCQILTGDVPSDVDGRLRSQLTRLRVEPTAPLPTRSRESFRAKTRFRWKVASCVVLVVGLVGLSLFLQPKTGLAQVADAILKQRWIHVKTAFADNLVAEGWFSPERAVTASRNPRHLRYEDFRRKVYETYKLDEKVLYRSAVSTWSETTQFESLMGSLAVLFQSRQLSEKSFEELGLFGSKSEKYKIVEQRVEPTPDGQSLDYHLTVKLPKSVDVTRLVFRVDAKSKLPRSMQFHETREGKPVTRETLFDYPEMGPIDIFELGVPRDTQVVNRIPSDDLQRITALIRMGQRQMDDYRAVFVSPTDGLGDWWREFPQVFYRKGDRFRRDFIAKSPPPANLKEPHAGTDRRAWWLEYAKQFEYYPCYLQLGKTAYNCQWKASDDPSTPSAIGSVSKHQFDAPWPIDYAMRPESSCRLLMDLSNEDQEAKLDLNPTEGPAGCVRIDLRRSTKEGRLNAQGIGICDVSRYWLDPQQDYIVRRADMLMIGANGEETLHSSHEVEETLRSPKGIWYATKIRLKNAVGTQSGQRYDQLYLIYVDFDVKLPDALFDVPKVGQGSQKSN